MTRLTVTDSLTDLVDAHRRRPHEDLAAAWLAAYRSSETRQNYTSGIKRFFEFLDTYAIDPLSVKRPHVDLFLRSLEADGCKPRTVSNRLTIISSFYRYLVEEEVIGKNPCVRVVRPKTPRKSPTGFLRRAQLSDLVRASAVVSPMAHAAISILVFNGLRVGELCSLDVSSLGKRGHYPLLTFTRKGGEIGTAVLGRSTEAAVMEALGGRQAGPLLLTRINSRIGQQWVQRQLERCRPAIQNCPERLHPHLLRHSWTAMAMADGVSLDQIVHDGGWCDARMPTTVYAHGQEAPEKAAAHRIESLVMSL